LLRRVGRRGHRGAALPHQLGQSTETSAIYLSAIERAAAQSENVTKTRRHRMGITARVRRGLHSGIWPYGYRAVRYIDLAFGSSSRTA
jgi:hypothetical protein